MEGLKTIDVNLNASEVSVCATETIRNERECNNKMRMKLRSELKGDFTPKHPVWSEWEVVKEAKECLYCGIAGCQKSCPANVNIKEMLHSASVRSWYHAGKVLYSANPLGAITSYLCECEEGACMSGCHLTRTQSGALKIGEIQKFIALKFLDFDIPASRRPTIPEIQDKIAIVGAGPAGLSTATYLARAGFVNITVYESNSYAGGLPMSQISQHRLPKEVVDKEVRLLHDYGIQFKFNTEVTKEMVEEMKKDHKAIIFTVGRSKPNMPRFGVPPELKDKVVTSKDFLEQVNREYKFGGEKKLDLTGKTVLVLGAGNTALDCCECAYRLGAESTRLVFRREMKDIRASSNGINDLRRQGVEFSTLREPTAFTSRGVLTEVMKLVPSKPGVVKSSGQYEELYADLIIVSFGAQTPKDSFLQKYINHEKGSYECSSSGKEECHYYTGGDFRGSFSVIEAVNDGRNIAAKVYEQVTGKKYSNYLTEFYSEVDSEDISAYIHPSVRLPNPFIASSSPATINYDHIKNCYLAGFGGAVTRTICPAKDIHTENTLRVFRINRYDRSDSGLYNNSLISNIPPEKWVVMIKKLKEEFPDRVLIASILCLDIKEDWQSLAKMMEDAGADAIELNLSCPNQFLIIEGKSGELQGIGNEDVEKVTRYVREAVKIPIFAKLAPDTAPGSLEEYAMAAIRGGADGITYSNAIGSIPRVQLDGTPVPLIGAHGSHRSTISSGGYSGSSIRPIVLNGVARIFRKFKREGIQKSKTIMGVGGVDCADTAMQYIYCGATAVQVCSAIQTHSIEVVQEMKAGIRFILYANRHIERPQMAEFIHTYHDRAIYPDYEIKQHRSFNNEDDAEEMLDSNPKRAPRTGTGHAVVGQLSKCIGVSNNYFDIRPHIQQCDQWICKATVNTSMCIGCGTCVVSCRDGGCGCIFVDSNNVVRIVEKDCDGCGLCATVCPIGCISMMPEEGTMRSPTARM